MKGVEMKQLVHGKGAQVTDSEAPPADSYDYTYVTVFKSDLEYAASKGTITTAQANELWPELESQAEQRYQTTITHIFYYTGALMIIASMAWFTELAWEDTRSLALFFLSMVYVAAFSYAGSYFWGQADPTGKIVGGLFTTVAVGISPVATFALERYFDVKLEYPHILQEATVVIAGIIALYYVAFPFITLPITLGLYAFGQVDLVIMIFGEKASLSDHTGVSIIFGAITIAIGYIVQTRNYKADYSFWLYLYGLSAFSGGLNVDYFNVFENDQAYKLAFLAINLGLMGMSVYLKRVLFFLFGGLGVATFVAQELYQYGSVETNAIFSVASGAVMCISAYYVDKKDPQSLFPFWGYLFGALTLEMGLSTLTFWPVWDNQVWDFAYGMINIGLALLYIPTRRDVFLFVGSVGFLSYAGEIVNTYFHAWALPILLTAIGLGLIGVAVYVSTHKLIAARKKRNAAEATV